MWLKQDKDQCLVQVWLCVIGSIFLNLVNDNFMYVYAHVCASQVDNNVTRHLDSTLKRDDWDMLILHYLGLDHIGHISGPHSSLIGPKLLEMDDIIKKIHLSLISTVTHYRPLSSSLFCVSLFPY